MSVSVLIGVVLLVALVYVLTAGRFAGVAGTDSPEAVAERLAPIGKANTDPAAVAAAAAPTASGAQTAAADSDPGAAVYNRFCQACHASGAAGAPLIGNKDAWQPRIDQGMDALMNTALNGKGAMPPRGTCTDCSDDDLRAAIEYMVSKVQ